MLAIKRMVQAYAILAFSLAFVIAKDESSPEDYDPSAAYDPSNNYRPRNVTGLGDFYSWVGS
jgi:hypothetical protein